MRVLDPAGGAVQLIDGPAGAIEVLLDAPAGPAASRPAGVVLLAHPQPLLGGDARHKLLQYLARGLAEGGWRVLRPNFRGVGCSAGTHDEGEGEADDLLWLAQRLQSEPAPARLVLVGFSFGAFVQARVARRLAELDTPAWRTVLAGLPSGQVPAGRRYDPPEGIADALVVHGELDDRVPLQAVLDWARPQAQPVVVVPGADHFFTGKLHVLRALLARHIAA